jgi:hypothetical protein
MLKFSEFLSSDMPEWDWSRRQAQSRGQRCCHRSRGVQPGTGASHSARTGRRHLWPWDRHHQRLAWTVMSGERTLVRGHQGAQTGCCTPGSESPPGGPGWGKSNTGC